jgi:hypothetical protein
MSQARGIVRLLRLPLFVTAVVDVLAGYLVALAPDIGAASWRTMALLAGTSAGLYLFGMVQNDVVDVRRDRALKVPRPLVTGEAGWGAAIGLLIGTAVLAAVCLARLPPAAILPAVAAFGVINLYNLGAKYGPSYVAMSVMGACRLFNYGIGVTAAIGIPHVWYYKWEFLTPVGPLWVRHALALFFVAAMISGYSLAARHGLTMSARPWQWVFVVVFLVGFGLMALPRVYACGDFGCGHLSPPVARLFALLLLPVLWPGGLWSALGPARKPQEYGRFIERTIYWMMLLDVAFVVDATWMRI